MRLFRISKCPAETAVHVPHRKRAVFAKPDRPLPHDSQQLVAKSKRVLHRPDAFDPFVAGELEISGLEGFRKDPQHFQGVRFSRDARPAGKDSLLAFVRASVPLIGAAAAQEQERDLSLVGQFLQQAERGDPVTRRDRRARFPSKNGAERRALKRICAQRRPALAPSSAEPGCTRPPREGRPRRESERESDESA